MSHRKTHILTTASGLLLGCLITSGLSAQESALSIYPAEVSLNGKRDFQRIVVVATDASGLTRDVSAQAKIEFSAPGLATIENGRIFDPTKDGTSEITVRVGKLSAKAKLVVSGANRKPDISFRNQVIPILTRSECNAGSCHGSATGKNGFKLTLFGYAPEKDHLGLTRELAGRRLNLANPHASLMLLKPTKSVKHKGGQRLQPDSTNYNTILEWIQEGARPDPATTPDLVGVEIMPPDALIGGPSLKMQFTVRARYSNGTDKDVTDLAILSSSNENSASIDGHGLVTSSKRGEAAIMARYGSFAVVSQVIVLPDGKPLAWPASIRAHNYIDDAIHAKLAKLRLLPVGLCDDSSFIRRAYLDILNFLPTVEETRKFLADTSKDKRAKLVDHLLTRPEFPDVWAMQWAEILKVESRTLEGKGMHAYTNWLKAAFRKNQPIDQIVKELLTGVGGSFESPPVNFYIAERAPQQRAEAVAQLFMGIRLQCAQCHNHPFERWTMDDYYGFAAFFTQIGNKRGEDPRETIIYNRRGGEVNNLRTGRPNAPKFLGGSVPTIKPGVDRRQVLADWLTTSENPWFAKNIANRVFARFFGRGIVDPPDDVRVSNPPSHPFLHDLLGQKLVGYNFDVRQLIRDICASRSYQLAMSTEPSVTETFAAMNTRRLTAEQLLDAISQVAGVPTKYRGLPLGARATNVGDAAPGNRFLDLFGRPRRTTTSSCERRNDPSLGQVLHLINGTTIANKLGSGKGLLRKRLAAKTPAKKLLTEVWLAAYSREPRPEEAEKILATITEGKGDTAVWEDTLWAVLNSKEFLFNH
ncbi:MAG: DUF1549 domain-containing protein [Planctomycetota bacterium]|jgi:hypothetical protein|nr:DUF1549 domain-containing protein [Planctomycetota bacterium]